MSERGGYRWGTRHSSVESCHSFSAWMRFYGAQRGGDDEIEADYRISNDCVILTHKRDAGEYFERITLTETRCHFGGSRHWLICPNCGRRVGRVYLPTTINCGEKRVQRWLCRHCYRLTYEQRRSKDLSWVLEWRAERLLERHRITTTPKWHLYRKPKGMKWKTFKRLTDKANAIYAAGNDHAYRALGKFFDRHGGN